MKSRKLRPPCSVRLRWKGEIVNAVLHRKRLGFGLFEWRVRYTETERLSGRVISERTYNVARWKLLSRVVNTGSTNPGKGYTL